MSVNLSFTIISGKALVRVEFKLLFKFNIIPVPNYKLPRRAFSKALKVHLKDAEMAELQGPSRRLLDLGHKQEEQKVLKISRQSLGLHCQLFIKNQSIHGHQGGPYLGIFEFLCYPRLIWFELNKNYYPPSFKSLSLF